MKNNTFSIEKLKNLILLGSGPFLKDLENLCKKQNINFFYISTKDQIKNLSYVPKKTLSIERLDKRKILSFLNFSNFDNQSLFLSIGARWIFKKEHIVDLFNNRLVNCHGTRLPIDRGGGGFSWRIMRGDRLGNILLHLIDKGIDKGPIIYSNEYVIPINLNSPKEISDDYKNRLKNFLIKLITETSKKNKKFQMKFQTEAISTYFPRLNTLINGFIDWSWDGKDIQNFILAFDEPYDGAKTFLNNKQISLAKSQLHSGEINLHPYQSGLVIRKTNKWCIVALSKGYTLIIESIKDKKNRDMMDKIKVGDRFSTPNNFLEKSKKYKFLLKN